MSAQKESTDKELKHMSRSELVEVIYELEKDNEALNKENAQLRAALDDKYIRLNNAGSLAEAALSLNHIFEDAQAAADQYLYSVKRAAAASAATQPASPSTFRQAGPSAAQQANPSASQQANPSVARPANPSASQPANSPTSRKGTNA